jgi:hypothetical protein
MSQRQVTADAAGRIGIFPLDLPELLHDAADAGEQVQWLPVAFRIIWRNVSELFGVVSALRRNPSRTEAATNMAAIHKQNQIFTPIVGATLGSREVTLVLPVGRPGLSGTPNSSQTLRHIAIKATGSRIPRKAGIGASSAANIAAKATPNSSQNNRKTHRPLTAGLRVDSPSTD